MLISFSSKLVPTFAIMTSFGGLAFAIVIAIQAVWTVSIGVTLLLAGVSIHAVFVGFAV